MVKKKKKDLPGEHGWCWQEDHSVRSDRLQQPLLSQDQLAMSSPGDDDDIIVNIDACEDEDENVEDVKDFFSLNFQHAEVVKPFWPDNIEG